MAAYYNEHDREKAAWLRELQRRSLIAPGDVDERSIEVVSPGDLARYTQCHFFAGIGVWSYALRSAGWADDARVWTGSCPCQPFSSAGQSRGADDHRHLWPAWFRLIRECRPDVVFGEQVASADGLAWLDVVSTDVEGAGYAIGAADLCAAGVGAPHIRQRFYFVADATSERIKEGPTRERREAWHLGARSDDRMGHAALRRSKGPSLNGQSDSRTQPQVASRGSSLSCVVADAERGGREESDLSVRPARQVEASTVERGSGYWSAADWIPCADGKARPVEPGTFPLVDGTPACVVRLRGYGDAIVAPLAQAFIEAYLDVRGAA